MFEFCILEFFTFIVFVVVVFFLIDSFLVLLFLVFCPICIVLPLLHFLFLLFLLPLHHVFSHPDEDVPSFEDVIGVVPQIQRHLSPWTHEVDEASMAMIMITAIVDRVDEQTPRRRQRTDASRGNLVVHFWCPYIAGISDV